MKENYIVIGGGVASLYTSIFLTKRGHQVTLIDSADEVGGLLRSFKNEFGDEFDYGSHFLRDTGIPEMDAVLFESLPEGSFSRLGNLFIGTYFRDQFYEGSPFINANLLSESDNKKGMSELMELPVNEGPYQTCYEYNLHRFGPTYTEKMMREPIEKLCGEKLEKLASHTNRYFDLTRIIAGNPELTRDLKKIKWFDDRLAFHSYKEGQGPIKNYYPTRGGIGQWVDHLKSMMDKQGVETLLSTGIENLSLSDKGVQLTLKNGRKLLGSKLIWSVAPFQLLQNLKSEYRSQYKPRIRSSLLFLYTFDKPILVNPYYAVCFSNKFKSFRIFFSSNVNTQIDEGRHRVCVEVNVDPSAVDSVTSEEIHQELVAMKFVAPDAKKIYNHKITVAAGFPVATPEFVEESMRQRRELEKYPNLVLMGRARGDIFFMNETLVDAHRQLKVLVGEAP